MPKNKLTILDVTDNISMAMEGLANEEIAEIHNQICSRKVRSIAVNKGWEYTGEDDNEPLP